MEASAAISHNLFSGTPSNCQPYFNSEIEFCIELYLSWGLHVAPVLKLRIGFLAMPICLFHHNIRKFLQIPNFRIGERELLPLHSQSFDASDVWCVLWKSYLLGFRLGFKKSSFVSINMFKTDIFRSQVWSTPFSLILVKF